MKTANLISMACVGLFLAGCEGSAGDEWAATVAGDPSMMLTGTESAPLVTMNSNGTTTLSCPSPKVLICHIPPGNPANEHSICVGAPAVPAHKRNHGDNIGACGPTGGGAGGGGGSSGAGGGGAAGGGAGGSGGAGGAGGGATAMCKALGAGCSADGDCCDPLTCQNGVCEPVIQ